MNASADSSGPGHLQLTDPAVVPADRPAPSHDMRGGEWTQLDETDAPIDLSDHATCPIEVSENPTTGAESDTGLAGDPDPLSEADADPDADTDRPPVLAAEPPAPPRDIAAHVVRRAVDGDDRAFATIVEHYDPMVRELTFHLLGDRAGMDGVLQTAYVKAYRALPRLPAAAEAGPWLYRIAYLACLDELRRRHRHPARTGLSTQEPAAVTCSDAQQPVQDAPRSDFSRAFAGLAVDHRAAVLLVDRAGLPIGAVADVLGLPEAAVAEAMMRAKAVLGAALDERVSEPDLELS